MTAIRDRRSEPDTDDSLVNWDELPIAGERPGLPSWAAVLIALGLSFLGAFVDFKLHGAPGFLYKACYFLGSVAAICAVQRRGLFTPMVQPPLILGFTVPVGILLFSSSAPAGDGLSKVLKFGKPLIDQFPTMAITTGIVLAIGIYRIFRERDPQRVLAKESRTTAEQKRKEARPPQRTSAAREGKENREKNAPGEQSQRPRRRPVGTESSRSAIPRRTRPPEGAEERSWPREERKGSAPASSSGRQPRGTRGADEPRRTSGTRTSGTSGTSRTRRPAEDPRAAGQEDPRRVPPRRDAPPPRASRRPWDNDKT